MKYCSKCKSIKDNFSPDKTRKDGLAGHCRDCNNKAKAKWRLEHKEYNDEQGRKWYRDNKERSLANSKKWRTENKEYHILLTQQWRENNRERRNASVRNLNKDPQHRMMQNIRSRVSSAIRGTIKPASSTKSLGCTPEFLKNYLESKFLPGMSWNNYGKGRDKWNIDHILPLDSFDLANIEQFHEACNYVNLQPLWEPDNIRKSNKIL